MSAASTSRSGGGGTQQLFDTSDEGFGAAAAAEAEADPGEGADA